MSSVFSLFFFQAEDGIRDWSVTGVQTCALPISGTGPDGVSINPNLSQDNIPEDVQDWSFQAFLNSDHAASIDWCKTNLAVTDTPQTYNSEIGRASCRERVKIDVGAGMIKKKT